MAGTRKRSGGKGFTWLEFVLCTVFLGVIAALVYVSWPAGAPVQSQGSDEELKVVVTSQAQAAPVQNDATLDKAWGRLNAQKAAIEDLLNSRAASREYRKRLVDEVMRQERRTRDLETRFQLLGAALLLLAVLSLGALIWLTRQLSGLRKQAAMQQDAERAQTTLSDRYAERLTKIESDLSDLAGQVARTGAATKEGGIPRRVETPPTPPPPRPPNHWPEIRLAADGMRALLNEQKASPDEYANIISRFPQRWVITARGLEPFSADNPRDHEIVLFGHDDAMVALPAQFAVARLSGSYSDPSRAESWFHDWFDIGSSSGRPFEIVRAAEAIIQDGEPEMRSKGAITLRG